MAHTNQSLQSPTRWMFAKMTILTFLNAMVVIVLKPTRQAHPRPCQLGAKLNQSMLMKKQKNLVDSMINSS